MSTFKEANSITGNLKPAEILHPASLQSAGRIVYQGKTCLDFTNWDFFNLAVHPRVKRALCQAIDQDGTGIRAGRLSSGTSAEHLICEKRLAQIYAQESAFLFSSRNQAVFTLITSLCTEGDLIVLGDNVQTPVADAAYFIGAETLVVNLSNSSSLEAALTRGLPNRRCFVFLETISSLTAEQVDLAAISATAHRLGAFLIIDESNAFTACGLRGTGVLEMCNLQPGRGAVLLDLSLAAAMAGSAVISSRETLDRLLNNSKTLTWEAALPPLLARGISETIDLAELMVLEREQLKQKSDYFKTELSKLILGKGMEAGSALVCLPCESLKAASDLRTFLLAQQILCDRVVARGHLREQAYLRFLINAGHKIEDFNIVLEALARALKERKKT